MVRRVLLGIAVVGVLIGYVQVSPSHAIPAFARQYDMQCNACHTRPPRLNPFGEQFHMMGFQIPGASRPDVSSATSRTTGLPGEAGQSDCDLAL